MTNVQAMEYERLIVCTCVYFSCIKRNSYLMRACATWFLIGIVEQVGCARLQVKKQFPLLDVQKESVSYSGFGYKVTFKVPQDALDLEQAALKVDQYEKCASSKMAQVRKASKLLGQICLGRVSFQNVVCIYSFIKESGLLSIQVP